MRGDISQFQAMPQTRPSDLDCVAVYPLPVSHGEGGLHAAPSISVSLVSTVTRLAALLVQGAADIPGFSSSQAVATYTVTSWA